MKKQVYEAVKHKNIWYIKAGKKYLLTPNGFPVGTRKKSDILTVLEDLKKHGADPCVSWSLYSIICSYLDYGSTWEREDLVKYIIGEIEDDPVYQDLVFFLSMDVDVEKNLNPAIYKYLSERNVIRLLTEAVKENKQGEIDLTLLYRTLFTHLCINYSCKGIMSIIYFSAFFHAPLSFMTYVNEGKSRSTIKNIILKKNDHWPYPPENFTKDMKFLVKFAFSDDDYEEVIETFKTI